MALLLSVALSASGGSDVHARPLPDGAAAAQPSPLRPLSETDAQRYRRIFTLQDAGAFAAADREIARLDDQILLGHVLRERYLHPRAYRSTYDELAGWMRAYADQPGADRVHVLAERRRPRGAADLASPRLPMMDGVGAVLGAGTAPIAVQARPPETEQRSLASVAPGIARSLRADRPQEAVRLLRTSSLPQRSRAIAEAGVAAHFLQAGDAADALNHAEEALRRGAEHVPLANWTAGLAAWRLGRFTLAEAHFGRLARSEKADAATLTSAAFWASRAAVRGRNPGNMVAWLKIGAQHPETFYGLLSSRMLGMPPPAAPLPMRGARAATEGDDSAADAPVPGVDALISLPPVRRAAALIQAGRVDLAGDELSAVETATEGRLHDALLELAGRLGLPTLQMRLAAAERNGVLAPYPVPQYSPHGGYRIDRALVYALVRQESRFDARARNPSGARGLMQLLPSTAMPVARAHRIPMRGPDDLFRPEVNLAVGQAYVRSLMSLPEIGDNLLYLAAAYNAGPAKLIRWTAAIDDDDDPLLFLEMIPNTQTRTFAEQVLADLWIYKLRMGRQPASLDALLQGDWPRYQAPDDLTGSDGPTSASGDTGVLLVEPQDVEPEVVETVH
ncbi:transglycosylase SLT domain-containing protein [Zavarzinia sp. CC-PAN008]|uniref:lytic transglycosylase domain-containing protein n=1 Tax=Zavarzinia sp. CC-PAN008 TaxID=3243332 RepID=UPI003F747DFE